MNHLALRALRASHYNKLEYQRWRSDLIGNLPNWAGFLLTAITMSQETVKYDAIVIGSGAAGGMAAKCLTDGGASVLVLEAGPELPATRWRDQKPPPPGVRSTKTTPTDSVTKSFL